MTSSNTPVCPLLSIRHPSVDALCLEADCALYLPPAKKCSLLYIGFKAMAELQRMQQQPTAASPQSATRREAPFGA